MCQPISHNNYSCTCCLYGTVRNGFEAGNIHYEGHWRGVDPGNRDFLGHKMATSEAFAIWAQKSRDFRGPPLPMPRVMDLPASKPFSISSK